jgi:polar amino acid transport system substrate-binding protein
MKCKRILASVLFVIVFFVSTITVHARETLVLNTFYADPVFLNFLQSLTSEAFNSLDMDVRVRTLPADRCLKDANSDNGADGDALRTSYISKDFRNLLKVPEEIFTLTFVAFSKDKDFQTNNWGSLKPYNVAHIKGMKAITRNLSVVKPKSVQEVENAQLLFTLLAKGRTDVVVWGSIEGLIANEKLGQENEGLRQETEKIRVLHPSLQTLPKYLFLNKRHKKLIPEIDAVLKEMKKNGSYQRIYEQAFERVLSKHNL